MAELKLMIDKKKNMGSKTVLPRIPLIDLSSGDLKPGSDSWNSTCQEVRKALEEQGCLELVYSEPTLEFHNTFLEATEEILKLPCEIKRRNINPNYYHGYRLATMYESVGIENPTNNQECQDFTHLMWPQGNQHFCETIHSYAKIVAEAHELLHKMLCESYGIEKEYTESHIKSTRYLLRLFQYKRSYKEDTNMALPSHTDQSFFTILHQNHVKGLELKINDGEDYHWIPYRPSSPSSFLVLVGDACMAWSNDRLKPGTHRVTVEDETRYSIGLFSYLKGLIKAPKKLVDEEHPCKYKPFYHQQFLDYCKDPKSRRMVKTFCGI